MKLTLTVLLTAACMAGTSFAETTSTSKKSSSKATGTDKVTSTAASTTSSAVSSTASLSDLYKKLDESPFSARYLMDNRAAAKVDGVTTVHHTYIDYKLDKYHKFTLKPSFTTYSGAQNDDKQAKYNSTEFRVYRFSVLNSKDHGVGYTAQLRNNILNGRDKTTNGATSSHTYLGYFSKSFGKLSLLSQHIYSVNNSTRREEEQAHSYDYFDMIAQYSLTDNLYVSANPQYYRSHTIAGNGIETTSYVFGAVEVGYSIDVGRGFDIALNYDSTLASKSDGKALKFKEQDDMLKKGKWSLTVYTSLF